MERLSVLPNEWYRSRLLALWVRPRMKSQELSKNIRLHTLHMTNRGRSSHIGSAFSITDILAVLYAEILQVFPGEPKHPDRDRFILSKGHAGAAVYAVLAERGFFPISTLATHYKNGSKLSGHVSHKDVPGVELSTGSLGHGLPVGTGMALSAKLDDKKHRIFVLLSDGECDEGSNWEAILFGSHHKLDNLVAIVDYNKLQSIDTTENTLGLEPFRQKWESFGWQVVECDGHDHAALSRALKQIPLQKDKPTCLIAHTTKGKGVSFMENKVLWHYRPPEGEEFSQALRELEGKP